MEEDESFYIDWFSERERIFQNNWYTGQIFSKMNLYFDEYNIYNKDDSTFRYFAI